MISVTITADFPELDPSQIDFVSAMQAAARGAALRTAERIHNEGRSEKGPFSPYSKRHAQRRKFEGLQTSRKDFTFTGRMLESMRVRDISKGSVVELMRGRNRKIGSAHANREGALVGMTSDERATAAGEVGGTVQSQIRAMIAAAESKRAGAEASRIQSSRQASRAQKARRR